MGTMKDTTTAIDAFCNARGWNDYHTPRSLSLAIASEVGELCHLYRWADLDGEPLKCVAEDEIADVLIFTLRMCSVLGIDPAAAINRKLVKNGEKYPI